MRLDDRAGHLGEAPRETACLLVPPFLRERRPAADVGDQERVTSASPVASVRSEGALRGSPTGGDPPSGGTLTRRVWTRVGLDATDGAIRRNQAVDLRVLVGARGIEPLASSASRKDRATTVTSTSAAQRWFTMSQEYR